MSYLGQTDLIIMTANLISQVITTTGNAISQKTTLSSKEKLEQLKAQAAQNMSAQDAAFRQQQTETQYLIAKEQKTFFNKIALLTLVGVIMLGSIITGGVYLVKSKGK